MRQTTHVYSNTHAQSIHFSIITYIHLVSNAFRFLSKQVTKQWKIISFVLFKHWGSFGQMHYWRFVGRSCRGGPSPARPGIAF